jgi:hypothetical protein
MMTTLLNGNSQTDEDAERGVMALSTIVHQRNDLLKANDRLTADNMLMRERIAQLTSRLETATTERDHFMNFSTELVSRLSSIDMLIKSAVEEAKHVAYRAPIVPPPPTKEPSVSEQDTAAISALLKRLPHNGGGEPSEGSMQ